MIPLTKEENKSYKEQKYPIYAKKSFVWIKMMKIIKIKERLKITVITQENLEELLVANAINLNCICFEQVHKIQKNIPIIIHNARYDTQFIINQLAEEFKGELYCIGEHMEKYITFSAPIKKKCDNGKKITYKLRFIDSFRFMPTIIRTC